MMLVDGLSIYINATVLIFVFVYLFLAVGGLYYTLKERKAPSIPLDKYPMVSVLIPAHNEEVVIRRTVNSIMSLDYPKERFEVIVINDNSQDSTGNILEELRSEFVGENFHVIHTNSDNGGKGKSNALNIAMEVAKGSVIAIYDADNTPQPNALRILVEALMADDRRAAVIGKYRTRNKTASLLTRFVNIESLSHQCLFQAGRYFYFRLCAIPGTNFVIRRSVIEEIGGWDVNALSEDTEITFRIYRMGYYIACMPSAVSWEQEPQKLTQWFRQRSRWARGNIYVFLKNFKYIFDSGAGIMRLDILYYLLLYGLVFTAMVSADTLWVMSMLGVCVINSFFTRFWGISLCVVLCTIMMTLIPEKEEFTLLNAVLILLMLFTYSKMWTIVVLYALYTWGRDSIRKQTPVWYKTTRYEEPETAVSAQK